MMSKKQALHYIQETIQADVALGWGSHLIDAPIPQECKISEMQNLLQSWEATNLQELLTNMMMLK